MDVCLDVKLSNHLDTSQIFLLGKRGYLIVTKSAQKIAASVQKAKNSFALGKTFRLGLFEASNEVCPKGRTNS